MYDIWTPTDVYTVRDLMNAKVLMYGQSTSGMTPESPVNLNKSIMPVAWTKLYKGAKGETGRVFTTTMGASIDFLNEDLRRLIVNACFWTLGMEKWIPIKANVDFISEYKPTMFGAAFFKKGIFPSNFELK